MLKFMLNNATKVCPYTILQKCALIHNEGYIPLKVRLVVLGQEKLSVYIGVWSSGCLSDVVGSRGLISGVWSRGCLSGGFGSRCCLFGSVVIWSSGFCLVVCK